jgi:hypothetical protein
MEEMEKELYDGKLKGVEKQVDLKLENIKLSIDQLRELINNVVMPLLESTHEQAKKTNGRVTRLEDKHYNDHENFEIYKKKIDDQVESLFKETDLLRILVKFPKITLAMIITAYIGLIFNDEVIQLIFKILQ